MTSSCKDKLFSCKLISRQHYILSNRGRTNMLCPWVTKVTSVITKPCYIVSVKSVIATSAYVHVYITMTYYERDDVPNRRRLDCFIKRLFRRRSKETSKLHIAGFCEVNSPVTGGFPSQRASKSGHVPFDDVIIWCNSIGYLSYMLNAERYQSHSNMIQYIPRNMHTVLLCFALLWLCNRP